MAMGRSGNGDEQEMHQRFLKARSAMSWGEFRGTSIHVIAPRFYPC